MGGTSASRSPFPRATSTPHCLLPDKHNTNEKNHSCPYFFSWGQATSRTHTHTHKNSQHTKWNTRPPHCLLPDKNRVGPSPIVFTSRQGRPPSTLFSISQHQRSNVLQAGPLREYVHETRAFISVRNAQLCSEGGGHAFSRITHLTPTLSGKLGSRLFSTCPQTKRHATV